MPTGLQLLCLYLLMYADDMVLFSESNSELQNMLNTLQNYTIQLNGVWVSMNKNLKLSFSEMVENGLIVVKM